MPLMTRNPVSIHASFANPAAFSAGTKKLKKPSPIASAARSSSLYGASIGWPPISFVIASAMLGRPAASKSVDRPVSRLSKRMT